MPEFNVEFEYTDWIEEQFEDVDGQMQWEDVPYVDIDYIVISASDADAAIETAYDTLIEDYDRVSVLGATLVEDE